MEDDTGITLRVSSVEDMDDTVFDQISALHRLWPI